LESGVGSLHLRDSGVGFGVEGWGGPAANAPPPTGLVWDMGFRDSGVGIRGKGSALRGGGRLPGVGVRGWGVAVYCVLFVVDSS